MANSKRNQDSLRQMLLRDGSVRAASYTPSANRVESKQQSQANAIAARRLELQPNKKKRSS